MRALIRRAVAGERDAVRALVDAISPIIQARAARVLLRRHGAAGRDVRQEILDLSQHVFLTLFADEGRFLLQWDPERGASLENYVGLAAEREIASILRSRRRNPWSDDPTEAEILEANVEPRPSPELQVVSRDLLARVLERLEDRLSARGLELFHWIVLDGRSVEEVCALGNLTPDAVYAWRSRLGRQLREIAAELMSDTGSSPRIPAPETAS
jgi:RNA polymerase sigma-70 factor (ECF subfamily)